MPQEAGTSQGLMKGKHYVEKANKDEVFKYHIAKVMEEDSSIQSEPVVKQ